jgi:hypothetical protein
LALEDHDLKDLHGTTAVSVDLVSIDRRVRKIINTSLKNEITLLRVKANERNITHKIAEYLQLEFQKDCLKVDCEYNRDGYDKKLLQLEPRRLKSDDSEGQSVYPDIIIHERGTNARNLVVIEAKKSTNTDGETDKKKLEAFKRELGYSLGYRLVVKVGRELDQEKLFELKELSEINPG